MEMDTEFLSVKYNWLSHEPSSAFICIYFPDIAMGSTEGKISDQSVSVPVLPRAMRLNEKLCQKQNSSYMSLVYKIQNHCVESKP